MWCWYPDGLIQLQLRANSYDCWRSLRRSAFEADVESRIGDICPHDIEQIKDIRYIMVLYVLSMSKMY